MQRKYASIMARTDKERVMDFSIKTFDAKNTLATAKSGCIAVGVFEGKKLSSAAKALDAKGEITAALKAGDISGKPGSTLLMRRVQGVAAERVLLVGLGKEEAPSAKDFSSAAQAIARAFSSLAASDAMIALPFDNVKEKKVEWAIGAVLLAARETAYRFDGLKSSKEAVPSGVRKIALAVSPSSATTARTALAQTVALANGMDLTKDLGNLPANICTPTYLADTAKKLGREFKLGVEVLDRKQIEALKMGSFLSVGKGSDEPPKFIILKYNGGKQKEAPIVLVGKGITFDSGGISIKPSASMDEMKYDMCGAASVLGTFRAVAELDLP